MSKKNQPLIENCYDQSYKFLVNQRFQAYQQLVDAIQRWRIKEMKTRLFPELTDSYANALIEYGQAQHDVWDCQRNLITAMNREKEYYNKYHMNFRVCTNYCDPNTLPSADEAIDRILSQGF